MNDPPGGGDRASGAGGSEVGAVAGSRSVGATLLVCCLLVLAGCGGGSSAGPPGGAEPTATATPAPVPTVTPDRYPPGVSAGWVESQVVATAMREELRGTAFTWTLEQRGTFGATATSTEFVGSRVHAEVAGPARYVLEQRLIAAEPGEDVLLGTTYLNGSRALSYDGENVTASPVGSAQLAYPSRVAANVAEYLRARQLRATPLPNGTVHVRGVGSDRPGVANYSVTALIGPGGTILRLNAEFTDDGRPAAVRFRLERGTTFEPPAWAKGADVTVTR